MTEIIIFLEDIDPVIFFGTNNSLLDKIRTFFPKIKIMARGNEIKCMGEESEITIFAEKFNITGWMNRISKNIFSMRST
jgi:phosphate starvation-inducible PhoH-like protein